MSCNRLQSSLGEAKKQEICNSLGSGESAGKRAACRQQDGSRGGGNLTAFLRIAQEVASAKFSVGDTSSE